MKSNVLKSDKVFIVAEIGNNHEGSFKNALKLIHAAADSNVDAVKFQTMCPSNFIFHLIKKGLISLININ